MEYFDLAEVLDNPSLVFEAGAAGNYAEMPVVGAEAYDGEDAIYLYLPCTRYCTPIYKDTTNSISTELEGPVIVSYFKRGGISLSVNFETPNSEDEVFIDHGEWTQHHVRITEPGSHHLRWAADGGIIGPGNGWIDQVQVDPMTENTFIHWALSYYSMEEVFTDLESLEVADHNHNGIPNLLEWALNKNLEFPYNTQIPKVVEEDGERYLGITYTRPADLGDYNIYLECTEDLNDWARILSTTTEDLQFIKRHLHRIYQGQSASERYKEYHQAGS